MDQYVVGLERGDPALIDHALEQACFDADLADLLSCHDRIAQDQLDIEVSPQETVEALLLIRQICKKQRGSR